MRSLILLLLLVSQAANAQLLGDKASGAALAIPAGWTLNDDRGPSLYLPPSIQREKGLPRRIHLRICNPEAKTVEEAMNREMENITERTKGKPSSNGREGFLAAHQVRTASGLEGVVGEFGDLYEGEVRFQINKFYFKNRQGRIFCVCAHVYGNRAVADECQLVILENLTLVEKP